MNMLTTKQEIESHLFENIGVFQKFVKGRAPASADQMDIEDAVMETIGDYLRMKHYNEDIPIDESELTGNILKRSTQKLAKIMRKSRLAKGIGCGKQHKELRDYRELIAEKITDPVNTLDKDGTTRKCGKVENLADSGDAASECIKKDETLALQSLLGNVIGLGNATTQRICYVYYQKLLCKEDGRVSVAEVAEHCGVSQQAASKALRKLGEMVLAKHPRLLTEYKSIKCA